MRWFELYIALAWLLRLAMIPVILRRQFAPGASLAWLGIIFLHPYIGGTLYLFLGETRLGPHRVQRHKEIVALFRTPQLHPSTPSPLSPTPVGSASADRLPPSPGTPEEGRGEGSASHPPEQAGTSSSPRAAGVSPASSPSSSSFILPPSSFPMTLQAEKISGLPVLDGNSLSLLTTSPDFTQSLAADIDAARSHVHLLYYLLACDPTGQTVTDALRRAAARGVTCRLLVDAVASRSFLKNRSLLRDLRRAGVHIAAALPAHYIQRRLPRMDLRNHRKLSVIDDSVAYVGSHNLIDPAYDGKRGGPWVDATARLTGPITAALSSLFAEDWAFETNQLLPLPTPTPQLRTGNWELGTPAPLATGNSQLATTFPIQPVPTGPAQAGATYRRLLLAAVQSAQSRLTLTTPYFVPDEPTLVSLLMAADRGVRVTLLLPAVSDNRLTQAAGRAHFDRLLSAGVHIYHYRPGLLHTKSVTVDDAFAIFGSANLDVRSFNLNFELSLVLYGPHATHLLHSLQSTYLADSQPLNPTTWSARPSLRRYTDSAISLLSPLL